MKCKLRSDLSSSVKAPSSFSLKITILLAAFTSIISTTAVLQAKDLPVAERSLLPSNNDTQNHSPIDLKHDLIINPNHQSQQNSHRKEVFTVKNYQYSERSREVKTLTRQAVTQTSRHELFRREIQPNPPSTTRHPPAQTRKPRPEGPQQKRPSKCGKSHRQNVSNAEGRISWAESQHSCIDSYQWLINVSTGYGIVFTFESVRLFNGFVLMVQDVDSRTLVPKTPALWKFLDNFMAPLLVRRNQVLLEVKRPAYDQYAENKPERLLELSSFRLTYAAHNLTYMPQEVQVDEGNGYRSSRVMYNCSIHPKEIPKVLQCDMTTQCVDGEDEEGCSYKSAGCGDWVPYGNQCLRAFFKPIVKFGPGRSHVTMPIQAEKVCGQYFRGILARLPDETGMKLAGKILRQSGYHSATIGLRKVKTLSPELKQLYRYLWQWGKRGLPVAYDQVKIQRNNPVSDCATYDLLADGYLQSLPCASGSSLAAVPDGFICMKFNRLKRRREVTIKRLNVLHLPPAKESVTAFPTKTCPDGSLVQTFHDCGWNGFHTDQFRTKMPSIFPDFQCQLGRSVHYSFVCDAVDDCADGSDEIGCMRPRHGPLLNSTFTCINSQTIPRNKQCNGIYDCFDNSDEEDCIQCKRKTTVCPASEICIPDNYKQYFESCAVPKKPKSSLPKVFSVAAVHLDGFGMSSLVSAEKKCGEGFFRCDKRLYIPTFLLNNGEQDCPTGIDEHIPVENFTCPGYYRCHHSGNCIHSRHLCDGIPHCPKKDDERYCNLSCPLNCTCEGYAYKCSSMFDPIQHLNTRYLDLSGVIQPSLQDMESMEYLLFLNLSYCELDYVNLTSMPQLKILDLSHNLLKDLTSMIFSELSGLRYLSLSHNPLVQSIDSTFTQFVKQSGMTHLKELLLVEIGIHSIEDNTIASLTELTKLDLSKNDITGFDKNVFSGLSQLNTLRADTYKLCCPYFHQKTIPECHVPANELSSCDDLLSSRFYHISVWILAVFNIPANIAVLVYRLWEVKKKKSKTYTILVGNLCLSDLLMGIYLVFIGSADVHYRNVWVSKEKEWTSSGMCKTAGILAFLSSEVSAFVVCLITLERFLVICFPLKRQVHMTTRSAWWACAFAWLLGFILVLVPLMAGWDLYGQTGFCLPLPITRNEFPGQEYVFAVFIYVNFFLFIIIGIGQLCIYRAIKSIRLSSSTQSKIQDMTIARRLMLIIVTDFLCWFPIGLMGVLASLGTPIPGEVNVWAALFILPFNSALNPHLYTFNRLFDQYREQRMNRRIQKTISKISAEIPKWPADKVESLLRSCLHTRVIQHKKILQWMKLEDYHVDHEELDLDITGGCEDTRSDMELTHSSTGTV